ncbi:MAG: hypothetical protein ABWY27_12895, partial [Telluria sp.]
LEKPDRAGDPAIAAQIRVWFIRKRQAKIRQHLAGVSKNYLEARALVNGKNSDGTVNGLQDFASAFDAALAAIAAKDKKAAGAVQVPLMH